MKDEGYITVGKVDRKRRTEHKGKNIDVRPKTITMFSPTGMASESLNTLVDDKDYIDMEMDIEDYGSSNNFEFETGDNKDVDNRYDFEKSEDEEEFSLEDSLTWIAEEIENEKIIKKPNTGMRFIAGIAFLTGGIFLATRRISRNN